MLTSVEGIYRNGKIELTEIPQSVADDTRVIVTFLTSKNDLRAHGIDEAQAADLRFRLKSFMEDWDDPAMDVYDDYDNALKALKADGE